MLYQFLEPTLADAGPYSTSKYNFCLLQMAFFGCYLVCNRLMLDRFNPKPGFFFVAASAAKLQRSPVTPRLSQGCLILEGLNSLNI